MTTKKAIRTIVLTVTLVLSLLVIAITLHTLSIGFDLAMISEQNENAETWRINPQGIAAANAVYEQNIEYRNSIYNSSNPYTKWISTSSKFTQIAVGFSLLALSFLSIWIWYVYITSKIKRFRKRLARMNQRHQVRRNGQTV